MKKVFANFGLGRAFPLQFLTVVHEGIYVVFQYIEVFSWQLGKDYEEEVYLGNYFFWWKFFFFFLRIILVENLNVENVEKHINVEYALKEYRRKQLIHCLLGIRKNIVS